MRRILLVLASALTLLVAGVSVPGSAQTTSSTLAPPVRDVLDGGGSIACVADERYEITWTLENVSDGTVVVDYATFLLEQEGVPAAEWIQETFYPGSLEPGQSSSFVSTLPGDRSGLAVLQTEFSVPPDSLPTIDFFGAGPLDGSCAPPSTGSVGGGTADTASARGATATPTYTG